MKEMTIDLGRNCAKCGIENPQFSIEMKLDNDRSGHRVPKLYCLKCLGEEATRQQVLLRS